MELIKNKIKEGYLKRKKQMLKEMVEDLTKRVDQFVSKNNAKKRIVNFLKVPIPRRFFLIKIVIYLSPIGSSYGFPYSCIITYHEKGVLTMSSQDYYYYGVNKKVKSVKRIIEMMIVKRITIKMVITMMTKTLVQMSFRKQIKFH